MGSLSVGVARRVINPPPGVFLVGYGDRVLGNRGVHDDVSVTALVLDDGSARVAIVAADLLTVCEATTDRVRARLAPVEVVICCSHTHSGPISYAEERSHPRDRRYVDALVDRIVDAVHEAGRAADRDAERSGPGARLEWAVGACELGVNRRQPTVTGVEIGENPAGPADRSVGVLGVVDRRGCRVATVVGHACHGTVLGPRNRLVSADWIGPMRERVERHLGGRVLFVQGACADINPRTSWDVADSFAEARTAGEQVADAVLAAVAAGSVTLPGTPVAIDRGDVWIPLQAEVRGAEPPRRDHIAPLLSMAGLPGVAAPLGEPLLRRRYPWRPTIAARDGRWAVPMRHSVLRLGEVALVAYGAETFTEIGAAAKAAAPAAAALFAGVADGSVSYLATAAAHAEGGYEVDVAPWAYRYPGRLDPAGEGMALAATREAFARLWGG